MAMRPEQFCEGEVVVIREWDDMEAEFGLNEYGEIRCKSYFVPVMKPLCGQEFMLLEVMPSGRVRLDGAPGYTYSTDMIVPYSESLKVKIEDFMSVLNGDG